MVGIIVGEVVSNNMLNMYNASIYCIIWCMHYCSSYNEVYIATCDICDNHYKCDNSSNFKYKY